MSQLVEAAQTQAIAHALDRLAELTEQPGPGERNRPSGTRVMIDAATTELFARIEAEGPDVLSSHRDIGATSRGRVLWRSTPP